MNVYRQGDVLLIPVDTIPGDLKPTKSLLLRRGEHGGRHELDPEERPQLYGAGSIKYIDAPRGARVIHGEHKPIRLPAGKYEVRVQREATSAGTRSVVD